jgi:hypothetical protein
LHGDIERARFDPQRACLLSKHRTHDRRSCVAMMFPSLPPF